MQSPQLVDLALLAADEAERRHFEALNYRRARFLWVVFGGISFASLLAGLAGAHRHLGVAGAGGLAALAALFWLRQRIVTRRAFGTCLLATLCLEVVVWTLLATEEPLAVVIATTLVPLALLLLRLRPVEPWLVAGVTIGANSLRLLAVDLYPAATGADEPRMSVGGLVAISISVLIAAAIGAAITARLRREFLGAWGQAAGRERDRLRMRDELDRARSIQLAMLPEQTPAHPGLEIAAVCLPASEVGGDYFDYFPDGSRLTVAIGDVAGHGMASGLVLAGVRTGLHLLADELADAPAEVLARLSTVVARPGGQRLLMSLGLATFDLAAARASWVSAGHPAPLRFVAASGTGPSSAVSADNSGGRRPPGGQPPLGTRLPTRFEVIRHPLSPGDVWLLVSDGALETRGRDGAEIGEARLSTILTGLATGQSSATAILAGLQTALDDFRAGEPLADDLTMVVVRVAV
jgi:serine phosphatase RsbU (regulator of sigma subunit)